MTKLICEMSVFFLSFVIMFLWGDVYGVTSRIYLTKKFVTKEEWDEFIKLISNYNGFLRQWKIFIIFKGNELEYFINTECLLPASVNGMKSFVLKSCNFKKGLDGITCPLVLNTSSNAVDVWNHFSLNSKGKVKYIEIRFRKLFNSKIKSKIRVCVRNRGRFKYYNLIFGIASNILSINFEGNYDLICKGAPKYLDISKNLYLFKTNKANSILEVDTFPYLQGQYYLEQLSNFFSKHSIIFGSSGCGKSKFISLMISNIKKQDVFKNKYKIVVIDPHASLEKDIGGLGRVIDFKSLEDSINLFDSSSEDIVVSVSLLLDLFKGLISNYNSKLERVLRHSLYLLISLKRFNFNDLRKLLLDMEFRNGLVREGDSKITVSTSEFFLTEFNELKTKSYMDAIAPLIAFIDEMEMIPVFNSEVIGSNLISEIRNNFLTIFSLDRTKLGDRVTKTISGLVMQQLFTIIQDYVFDEKIIFIVDEVATIENVILNRFLAEARKYNLSLILAGQYFNGISDGLKEAIFANVINYYIFRLSMRDANNIVDNFDMKIPLKDIREEKVKLITGLQDRECLVRVNANGVLLPVMKCRTLDFKSVPRVVKNKENLIVEKSNSVNFSKFKKFDMTSRSNMSDILKSSSTSRRVVKK